MNGSTETRTVTPFSSHAATADVVTRAMYTTSVAVVDDASSPGTVAPASSRQNTPSCNLASASTPVP